MPNVREGIRAEDRATDHTRTLRRLRVWSLWSGEFVAELLGVNPTTVGRWRTGANKPSGLAAEVLCDLGRLDDRELAAVGVAVAGAFSGSLCVYVARAALFEALS